MLKLVGSLTCALLLGTLALGQEPEMPPRKTTICRLENAPAADVAHAINDFLDGTSREEAGGRKPDAVVIADPVSNSLIISASGETYKTILELVANLDRRPPTVMVEVLIAEATSGTNPPAKKRPNRSKKKRPARSKKNAAEKTPDDLLQFLAGRFKGKAKLDGSVLTIADVDREELTAALKKYPGLEILSRPQIVTLDNQPAFVQVGERVPMFRAAPEGAKDQVGNVQYQNVGLMLGVTPRISPEGNIVMEIDVEKSKLGPVEEGIPISVLANGKVIRAPRIDITSMQTTLSVPDGQTIVLGRLVTKSGTRRTETVVLLTPRIVRTPNEVAKEAAKDKKE